MHLRGRATGFEEVSDCNTRRRMKTFSYDFALDPTGTEKTRDFGRSKCEGDGTKTFRIEFDFRIRKEIPSERKTESRKPSITVYLCVDGRNSRTTPATSATARPSCTCFEEHGETKETKAAERDFPSFSPSFCLPKSLRRKRWFLLEEGVRRHRGDRRRRMEGKEGTEKSRESSGDSICDPVPIFPPYLYISPGRRRGKKSLGLVKSASIFHAPVSIIIPSFSDSTERKKKKGRS